MLKNQAHNNFIMLIEMLQFTTGGSCQGMSIIQCRTVVSRGKCHHTASYKGVGYLQPR